MRENNYRRGCSKFWAGLLVWALLIAIPPCLTHAQPNGHCLKDRYYDLSAGLSHQQIYQIFQDSRGVVWLVTANGLNVFDGEVFHHALEWSLPKAPWAVSIRTEDNGGRIWIRFQNGSRFRFRGIDINTLREEQISNFLPSSIREEDLADISMNGSNKLLITNQEGELWQEELNDSWRMLNRNLKKSLHFCGSRQTESAIWLSDNYRSENLVSFLGIGLNGKVLVEKTLKDAKNWSVANNNSIWFYDGLRLGILDISGSIRWVDLGEVIPELAQIEDGYEKQITYDSKRGNVWLRVKGKLFVYNIENKRLLSTSYSNIPESGPSCFQIMTDSNGNSWTGSMEGLTFSKISNSFFGKLNWIDPKRNPSYFKNASRGIVEGSDKRIYFHSGDNILAFDRKRGKTSVIVQNCPGITSLCTDVKSNSIWFFLRKICQYNTETGVLNEIQLPEKVNLGVTWSGLDLGTKILWSRSEGLGYYDKLSQKFEPFEQYNGFDEVKSAEIYHIQKARNDSIWLLSNVGLFLMTPEKGILRKLGLSEDGLNYLPAENFRHYYRDSIGIFWFATANGLLKWNPVTGFKRLYSTKEGLSNNNLYAVYPDENGYLWISSDRGINQFNLRNEEVRFFLEEDGITHNEFNRISHFKTGDGFIFFGSLNGITYFNPRNLRNHSSEDLQKQVILMTANTKRHQGMEDKNLLGSFYEEGLITLNSNERNLTLKFGFPAYHSEGISEFSYRMEGADTTWIPSETSKIQLVGLGYGRHTLLVRAKARHDVNTSAPISIPIMVLRPFYLQGWFIFCVLAIFSVAAIALIKQKIRKIEQDKSNLEAEVTRRKAKIRADNEIIEAQALEIKQRREEKDRFFANFSHEFKTPISLILGPVNHLRKQSTSTSKDLELLEIAYKNAKRILEMVNSVLTFSRLDSQDYEPSLQPVSPVQFLKNFQDEYTQMASARQINLSFNLKIDADLLVNLDCGLLRIILDNLLSNAFKFTPAGGSITLHAEILIDKFTLKIEDSGVGISHEEQPKIFERFYRVRSYAETYEEGTGIGLSLAKELAAILGGVIKVTSEKGKGSAFELQFPVTFPDAANDTNKILTSSPVFKESDPQIVMRGAPVLIVEDNRDFQIFLRLILSPVYSLQICANSEEALRILREGFRPYLIISDIMMPGLNGFSFVRQLKGHPDTASIPVLILTSQGVSEAQLNDMHIGVDDYLVKPFEEEMLFRTIARLLNSYTIRLGRSVKGIDLLEKGGEKSSSLLTDAEWLEDLRKKVNENLHIEAFSVNELANIMYKGRTAFYKKVQSLTGLTPNQYIMEARLLKARVLLEQNPRLTIKNLLPQIGLKHEEHFSKVFKERFGHLPTELKKY
jgi:signal transduction histidine kinase/CheY-like chemotaxis protein/AraC-like DNA-binding protein/ligand-binding sensor domain-containing protein